MGFFSWECKKCGVSMRRRDVADNVGHSQVVVIENDGTILKGEYDGYGRVVSASGAEREINIDTLGKGEPECYHRKCWEAVGKPTEYTGGSNDAADQGFFFGSEDVSDDDVCIGLY
jgi:hypothetical protein